MFPEDFEIRLSDLIRLWVAEGLIKPTLAKCLEEVAHEYLEDLIIRNLILAHKMGSGGKVKFCKMHDLIRDMCIIQAEKEKFLYIAKLGNPNISPNIETNRRLSISSPSKPVEITAFEALQSATLNRSWFSHGKLSRSGWWMPKGSVGDPSTESTISRIIHGFRLLKVVHVNDPEIHIEISNLSNLQCVFAGSLSSVSSMSLCWKLQTLVVEEDVTLPAEIWQMPQIRHLKIAGMTLPVPPDNQNVIILENLQTLKTVGNFKCIKQISERIPNLKNLRILYDFGSSAAREQVGNYCLNNLVCFEKLETLGIEGAEKLWTDIAIPISLKKLIFNNCRIPWEDLSTVGSLPNLEVVKLEIYATKGEEWNPIEGEFCRLKFLSIWGCDLKIWGAENYHFPCLEHLVLGYVNLEEIPISFAEIFDLQVIKLFGVEDSVWASAKEISDKRELLGFEPFQLRS